MSSHPKKNWASLPLSRVKTIMRSSPEVSSISPEAIALTAHSAELFISQLISDAFKQNNVKHKLEYKDLSQVVATNARMAFLQDILPKKIKVKDYHKIVEQNNCHKSDSNDEDLDSE